MTDGMNTINPSAPRLSLVIPMYNEREILPETVRLLRAWLDALPYAAEAVLTDDGSTDGSADAARLAVDGDARIRVVGYAQNRGKGGAVRYGVENARGEMIAYTDCDLAYGTQAVSDLTDALASAPDTDIVIGSRNLSGDGYRGYTFLRRVMSKTYLAVLRIAAGFSLSDSQCGLKCFSTSAAKQIFSLCRTDSFAFDLEVLMIATRLGLKIREYPVTVIRHRESKSKIHPLRDAWKMLGDIRRIRRRVKKLPLPSGN